MRASLAFVLSLLPSLIFAQTAPLAPVGLDPLIVGSIYEPGSPLLDRVELLADRIQKVLVRTGDAGIPAANILEAARDSQAPAIDRAAAATLARLLTDPREASDALTRPSIRDGALGALLSRERPRSEPMASLAETSKADTALSRIFDRGASRTDLKVDDLPWWISTLSKGPNSYVERHPRVPGAVIKTVDFTWLKSVVHATPIANQEETDARRLATLKLGPRYFGQAEWKLSGLTPTSPRYFASHRRSVREQVDGETVETLIGKRRFGPDEHRLAVELLNRMKSYGVESEGLNASNVMIGHTLAAPETRAYLVGGGKLGSFPETAQLFRRAIDEALAAYEARKVRWDRLLHPFQPKPAPLPSLQPLPGGAYRSMEARPASYSYEEAWKLFVRGKEWWRQGDAAQAILPLLDQPGVAEAISHDKALRRAVDQAAARENRWKTAWDRSIVELWEKLETVRPLDRSIRRKAAWLNTMFHALLFMLWIASRFAATWSASGVILAFLGLWVWLAIKSGRAARLVHARQELATRLRFRVAEPKIRVEPPSEPSTSEEPADVGASAAKSRS